MWRWFIGAQLWPLTQVNFLRHSHWCYFSNSWLAYLSTPSPTSFAILGWWKVQPFRFVDNNSSPYVITSHTSVPNNVEIRYQVLVNGADEDKIRFCGKQSKEGSPQHRRADTYYTRKCCSSSWFLQNHVQLSPKLGVAFGVLQHQTWRTAVSWLIIFHFSF